jgi:hypothetical protein
MIPNIPMGVISRETFASSGIVYCPTCAFDGAVILNGSGAMPNDEKLTPLGLNLTKT